MKLACSKLASTARVGQKNLPHGQGGSLMSKGQVLMNYPKPAAVFFSFLFFKQNAGTVPFLINTLSGPNSKDTFLLNKCGGDTGERGTNTIQF